MALIRSIWLWIAVYGSRPAPNPLIRAASWFLPLGLSGKPLFLACFCAQLIAIRGGRIPIDAEDRIIIATGRSASVVLGLGPVGDLIFGNYPSAGPELSVVIAGVV